MHFSLPSTGLRDFLRIARLVRAGDSTLPVLDTVRFVARPDQVTLSATDLDVEATATIAAPGSAPGAACIPTASLASLKPDKDTLVRFDLVEGIDGKADEVEIQIVAKGIRSTFTFETLPSAEFPMLSEPSPNAPVRYPKYATDLPPATFRAIAATLAFHSKDETRHVLQGALLDPAEGGSIIATDGRRLIRASEPVPPVPVILPSKACVILAARKPAASVPTSIATCDRGSPQTIAFRLPDGLLLTSRLIEGNYPNWRMVVPEPGHQRITFGNRAAVLAFLANLPKTQGETSIRLEFHKPSTIRIRHKHAAADFVAHVSGDPPTIAFNPAFFASALEYVGGTLCLTDEMSPGLFVNRTARAVVMPMRVHDKPKTPETPKQPAS